MVCFDGIYAADEHDRPHFQAVPAPETEEIARVTASLAQRIARLVARSGLGSDSDPEESDSLRRDEPFLAGLYAAAVSGRTAYGPHAGRRVTRIGDQIDPESVDWTLAPRCATINGFSLHANVAVHAEDRLRLERLVSYCARPPMAGRSRKPDRAQPLKAGADRASCRWSIAVSFQAPLAGWHNAYRDGTAGTAGKTFRLSACSQSSLDEVRRGAPRPPNGDP
jgi:hypothetical protein